MEYTINSIEVYKDHSVKTIQKNGKNYYVCSCCGRVMFKAVRSNKKIYCNKHYKQMKKYGYTLDDNPRTPNDKNEIHVKDEISYMDLYDKDNNVIAQVKFDTEDVEKVRYTKWRLSSSGYVMNTPKFKGGNKQFSRVILNTDQFVDHINHNTLDNRKENLRIVTKSQDAMNMDSKGVSQRKDKKWCAHIKKNGTLCNLGVYVDLEEALYARWYAEKLVFGEYAYPKEEPCILPDRKHQIQQYVYTKVQRL